MILELDRSYYMRNGVVTKLTELTDKGYFKSNIGWLYSNKENGNLVYSVIRESPHDLIKEV